MSGAYFVPDDQLVLRYQTWLENGQNYAAAARVLGVDEATVRRSVKQATRRNLTDATLGPALPAGYTLGRVTSLVGPDGTVMEWQHKLPEAEAVENMFEELASQLTAGLTPLPEIAGPSIYTSDLLACYPVTDVHLGQYSWAKETGENYDLPIAKTQFLSATTSLYSQMPACSTALIVVLGDFLHADNNEAETRRSHNHLDVDGRHDKVLHLGAELLIWHIDMALQRHHKVIVKVMRGNHDEYASKALTLALWVRYENNPRVTIERSPLDLWSFEWGINMLSFTHGDNVKAEDMPGVMAAFEAEMWGRTTDRYGFSGHYHKRKSGPLSDEKHGAVWEIIPAFTAKDAWNRNMGHAGQRGIKAMVFHKKEGRKSDVYQFIRKETT